MIGPLALVALAYVMFMALGITVARSTTVPDKTAAWRTFIRMQVVIAIVIVLGIVILVSINR